MFWNAQHPQRHYATEQIPTLGDQTLYDQVGPTSFGLQRLPFPMGWYHRRVAFARAAIAIQDHPLKRLSHYSCLKVGSSQDTHNSNSQRFYLSLPSGQLLDRTYFRDYIRRKPKELTSPSVEFPSFRMIMALSGDRTSPESRQEGSKTSCRLSPRFI